MQTNPIRRAMSLLEVVIAVSIFGLMMSMVGQSLVMGVKLQDTVGSASAIDDEANRVLQKIAGYLRTADYNYIYIFNPANGNVTCTFALCTGLTRHGPVIDEKKLRIFYDRAARTLTSTLYDTNNSDDESVWTSLEQVVATNLARNNGFVVSQQGTDTTYVKGNRLTLTVSMAQALRDGSEVTKSATTTLYLRSTIYFKDEQLASATDTTTPVTTTGGSGSSAGGTTGGTTTGGTTTGGTTTGGSTTTTTNDVSTTETASDAAANAPLLTLGPDTDNSVHTASGGSNVIINVYSSLKSTAQNGTMLKTLTVTPSCSNASNLTVTMVNDTHYKITGYAIGAVTVTVVATSKKGNTTYTSSTTRIY